MSYYNEPKTSTQLLTDLTPITIAAEDNKGTSVFSFLTSNPISKITSSVSSDEYSINDASKTYSSPDMTNNISYPIWIFIFIFVLAFLGINVFTYLAKGTEETTNFVTPIITWFSNLFTNILAFFGLATYQTVKQTAQTSAQGTKLGINAVADTTTGFIDSVVPPPSGEIAKTTMTHSMPVQHEMQQNGSSMEMNTDALDKALQDASHSGGEVTPDDSLSSIQSNKSSGWCYIGEDRGFRSCSQVGPNDTCMSGDIFPSQQVCINPNLRP